MLSEFDKSGWGHPEPLAEQRRLMVADLPLTVQNLGGVALSAQYAPEVLLGEAVLLHQESDGFGRRRLGPQAWIGSALEPLDLIDENIK